LLQPADAGGDLTFRQGIGRIIAPMARVIALTQAPRAQVAFEAMRAIIVCGCAIALIAAGRAFPTFAL
jgi:hypothetical protein